MYMNQLTIIGFTGADADFHYTPNGTAITTGGNERVLEE
jgi:single-stranded DNA-binding protein